MPKFSVIAPIYKVEPYLRQCIESVLNQSYEDFELILVDDGSPDNCPAICDEYAEKDCRIKVIHKSNGGIVSARLEGCQAAWGDYICCIDSDDWVHPEYLAKFSEVIEKDKPDVVCCGSFIVYEQSERYFHLPYRKGYYTKEDVKQEIFPLLIQNEYAGYFTPTVWGKAIKRELCLQEQRCVDSRIKVGEDGACIIPVIYRASTLYILEDCLYFYRQNLTSVTRNKKSFDWNGPKLIAEHLQQRINLNETDFMEQWYRKTVHELFSIVVSQFYRQESYFAIAKDICVHLKEPIYSQAIQGAKFRGAKGKLSHFALKHRILPLIKLYSIIK